MNKYIAFYNGQEAEIEAETLYAAQQKAVDKFRPRKSQAHMVHVHLCQLADDTEPVIHIAVD